MYKIRNNATGQYKCKGTYSSDRLGWSKNGKVWASLQALKGHFALRGADRHIKHPYANATIEEFDADGVKHEYSIGEFLEKYPTRRQKGGA